MVVPKVDHDCVLQEIVADLANRLAKLEHENAQLKKAVLGSRSEKSKMPRIKTGQPATPEERQKTRRDRAAAKAQTPTVRVDHKVPDDERRCKVCGNTKLDPLGDGKKTSVWEFVPARFLRVEHVQEVLRCRCNGFVVNCAGRAEGRRKRTVRRDVPRAPRGRQVR